MDRPIVGYQQDDEMHWVAELACGHLAFRSTRYIACLLRQFLSCYYARYGLFCYRLGCKARATRSVRRTKEALRRLGVKVVAPAKDEFEALGLNRHRSTEDWLEVKE